jgi:hypothetical protein
VTAGAASRLAWPGAAASVALALTGGIVAASGGALAGDVGVFFVLMTLLIVAASVVGALVATRQPANPIGWILCGFSLFMGLAVLATGYAQVAPDDGARGLGRIATWFSNWSFAALTALAVFVLLLFPDGRLPSPRWRAVAWCGGVAATLLAVGTALYPGPMTDYPDVTNPFGVEGPLVHALLLAGEILTVPALVLAVASVVVRYRRAGETARQQIKWLAVAGVFTACSSLVGAAVAVLGPPAVGYTLILLGMLAIPIAIGLAILRYRLYDVDLVISRSLTYAVVTILLAAAYAVLVLAGQAVFSSLVGGSNLAIAVSTLVVAALFLPLRRRVQAFVDRRFYRRRYDAARTLEAFGARLRHQVELDGLRADLQGVVAETMQPAHVSVWLRSEKAVTIP